MSFAEPQDEIDRLEMQAWAAGNNAEQARLLDSAVQLADAANDDDRAWGLRTQIFQPATFGGQVDLLLVHFAKALSMSDRDPEKYPPEDLLWPYKWAIDSALLFPHIPLARLHGLADDFARRMAERGEGARVSAYMRMLVGLNTGDFDAAREALAAYEQLEGDHWSDCAACEADRIVQFRAAVRDDAAALDAATDLLSGRVSCHDVPTQTYGTLQLPALRLGRPELCRTYFSKGYAKAAKEDNMMRVLGEHLQMLALTHNTERGLDLLSRLFARCAATPEVMNRWFLWLGAELLMHRLADRKTVKVALPASFEGYRPDGEYPVADLLDYFRRQGDALAAQFDRRNGNTWMSDHARHLRGLLDQVGPYEIKARAPRKSKPAGGDTE